MREEFLPFCRPSIGEDEVNAVAEVLRSRWITTGPKAAELEDCIRQRVGGAAAVAVTSGTAGMHVALQALGIGHGDEVITPSLTWVSTVNLIELLGAVPVFVDVDRDTLLVSPEAIESAITDRTRLIIPVHFAGAAVDLDGHRDVAARHGVALLEDAAHAIGARYRDREIGNGGTAIFSMHPIKNVTSGEGGVVVTDDAEFGARVRRLAIHGLAADAYTRDREGRAPQAEVVEPGFKYNLPDMNAALALQQLAHLDEFIDRRAEIASRYRELFRGVEEIDPLADPPWPHRHARSLFVVRLDLERARLDRDEFMAELLARNIGTGLHFKAVHLHSWYRQHRPVPEAALPNTEWNSARVCSLPLFPEMTDRDVDDVVEAIKDVLVSRRASAPARVSS
jgi:UDP-4-amino-4-deoxy-L-arabinose-oxoglutarate aminotransferase